MTLKPFQGTGTAMVTPFTAAGVIDEAALRRFVDFQIKEGIDMLLPCGTTGEGATLDGEESDRVLSIVLDQAKKRVPVIFGAGSNDTRKAVQGTERAKRLGADGVLSVGPYYNKPTQRGFYEHFKAVAEVGLPIIVYNVPGRTGSNIEASTMLKLAELPNIVAVKEASGNLGQMMDILRSRPAEFRVLSGDDAITLPLIAAGGDGVVSVVSNQVPGPMSQMTRAALAGDFARAREIHYRLLPLMNANFIESNPIPVKAVLAMMGMLTENYRLPLVPMTPNNRAQIQKIAEELGIVQSVGSAVR
ncbi:MAG TPA: 4-hydroxy-tetrahydrodipicolinate synthase [Terriglobia bacterium]|nr:4-hydroxy-tetrahydrodipicolinate synthase [Terriglobia bacterium]